MHFDVRVRGYPQWWNWSFLAIILRTDCPHSFFVIPRRQRKWIKIRWENVPIRVHRSRCNRNARRQRRQWTKPNPTKRPRERERGEKKNKCRRKIHNQFKANIDGGGDPFCIILIIYWRRSPCFCRTDEVRNWSICGCAWAAPWLSSA